MDVWNYILGYRNTSKSVFETWVVHIPFNFKFSVICLQESGISEKYDSSLIQLNGYNCVSQSKSCSDKGGLVMYINQVFDYKINMKINMYKLWEGQIIEVSGDGLTQTITIDNIYRPPRPSNENYK